MYIFFRGNLRNIYKKYKYSSGVSLEIYKYLQGVPQGIHIKKIDKYFQGVYPKEIYINIFKGRVNIFKGDR